MYFSVKKRKVENTFLGSIKFHSAFFAMTRELLHLVHSEQFD
jgi:hypothetical protein